MLRPERWTDAAQQTLTLIEATESLMRRALAVVHRSNASMERSAAIVERSQQLVVTSGSRRARRSGGTPTPRV